MRDLINQGRIVVSKIHTSDNAADFLTKPVNSIKFEKCMNLIGLNILKDK